MPARLETPPGGEPDAAGSRAPAGPRRFALLVGLAVALAALAPALGTLGAPLVAEDGAILGYAHRHGPCSDWLGPQYGLSTVRFWRPLVTSVWDLQERLFGVDPAALRAYNLAAHVACALCAALLAARLGLGRAGALVAGAWVATFPEQGGTVTWIAGRTDGTAAPLMVAACALALDERRGARWSAGLLAFAACAAKEMAFVLPVWAWLASWARGEGARAAVRRTAPVLAAVALAFTWRLLALGALVGGYPEMAGSGARGLAALGGTTWVALRTWAFAAGPSLAGALGLGLAALAAGRTRRPIEHRIEQQAADGERGADAARVARVLAAGAGWALAGAAPLYTLLADGVLEPQNLRVLRVADVGLGLVAAAGVAGGLARPRGARSVLGLAVLAGALALIGLRARAAWVDAREWAAAGEVAEAVVERAGALARGLGPAHEPVLVEGVPRRYAGAYALGFGFADRFRAPFEVSPRPVWPLRSLFGFEGHERAPAWSLHDGALAISAARRLVPELSVARADGAGTGPIALDERVAVLPDETAALVLGEAQAYELLLYTELGYEAARAPAGAFAPHDAGGAGRRVTLRELCLLSNGAVTLGETLAQAADIGAQSAYLEVRALDEAGSLVAVSDWIELVWEAELLARVEARLAAQRSASEPR